MKIAIAKIGANITFSSVNKSAAMADIKYALRVLGVVENEITICTHRTRNTLIPKPLSFCEIGDCDNFNDFDCVLVFNGSINFFGGAEDRNLLALYKALSKTTKRIFYVQTDGQLPFKKLWPMIRNRPWQSIEHSGEADYEIDGFNVTYLTQGRSRIKTIGHINSKAEHILPKEIVHYPWERCILHNHKKWFSEPKDFSDRQYQLGFGGVTRNAYKRKLIEKYYDSSQLDTLLFGNLRGVTMKYTEIKPKVSYQECIPLMNKCQATVIFGDELYNDNYHTLRMYEAILAGCIVFVDSKFDSVDVFYGRKFPELIVNSVKQVEQTLNLANPMVIDATAEAARAYILSGWHDGLERNKLNILIKEHL